MIFMRASDNTAAKLTGDWLHSATINGFIGTDYLHDGDTSKGDLRAEFTIKVPKSGRYEVRVAYTPNANRATNVPISITSADGKQTVKLNQREATKDGFRSIGTFRFDAAQTAEVVLSNADTDGHVIVDAVQVVAVP